MADNYVAQVEFRLSRRKMSTLAQLKCSDCILTTSSNSVVDEKFYFFFYFILGLCVVFFYINVSVSISYALYNVNNAFYCVMISGHCFHMWQYCRYIAFDGTHIDRLVVGNWLATRIVYTLH